MMNGVVNLIALCGLELARIKRDEAPTRCFSAFRVVDVDDADIHTVE